MSVASAFIGRTAELDALHEALEAIERGRAHAVQVIGPAGIGKTRLLAELARLAEARGHAVLAGAGAELEQDLPFWVFVDALDEFVEALDPRTLERMDEQVRSELGQVLPALAGAGTAAADPRVHERYRTHRAVRELLERLAATRPLVLVLDDVHWADAASVDLIVALLHRLPAAGVLLAVAARPSRLPAPLASALDRAHRDRTLGRLELGALSPDEARALVGTGDEDLYAESGGNPFFLEQLARAPQRGAAEPGPGVELAGLRVPPLVAAALAEELAALPAPARAVLEAAAVAGDPFEIDLAVAAAGVAEPAVLDAVDELARTEFVRETDVPRRFRFRHPIVRRAVYERTPSGWRIGAHERIARALADRGATATAQAHHVERSARHGDPAAIATLREAAAESATRAPATAARWLGAALTLLPDDAPAGERVELLLARARALIATGQFVDGHDVLHAAARIVPADAVLLRARVDTMLARAEHLLGQHEPAHRRLLAALDALPADAAEHGVSLMVELAMDGMHRLNYAAMHEWGVRAAEAARALDDDALLAAALGSAARGAAFDGRTDESVHRRDSAAALIDALPDEVIGRRLDALGWLAGAELYMHEFTAAHAHAARAIAIGRATGQGQQFPLLSAIFGMTAYFQGRSMDVIDELDGAIEAARLTGNAQTLAWSLYPRAMAAIALGDLPTALSTAQEAVDRVDDGKPSHHFSHSAFALAEAHLQLGNARAAADLLERAGAGIDMPLAAPSFRAFFLEAYARAQLALGDGDAAARAAREAVACADASRLPLQQGAAGRAVAAVALAAGDAARAAAEAAAAAELLAAEGAALEAARALILLGRARAAAGERDAAGAALERAAATATACGAVRYRDEAERELRQLGRRIHRRSQAAGAGADGVGALTARELEIARAIVDRRTNRQIAEDLFLSPKTVETHVRNIFAKLGVDSRVEVARRVEQADRRAASA
jgi:DNA-binding CsgD family transcriptional regulator